MDTQFDTELTKDEIERLALLLEECGEVQQIIGKVFRHGYYCYNPFDKKETTNKMLLCEEIAHLQIAINLMIQEEDFYQRVINNFYGIKSKTVNKYLHFNEVKNEQAEKEVDL